MEIQNDTYRTKLALFSPGSFSLSPLGAGCPAVPSPVPTHQSVEGRDGEDAQAAHGHLGGAAGEGQQPLGVGQLPALQAGQVTAVPEQIHLELLQVLLPHEDLRRQAGREGRRKFGKIPSNTPFSPMLISLNKSSFLIFPHSPALPTPQSMQIVQEFSLEGKRLFLHSWQKSPPGTTAPLIQC